MRYFWNLSNKKLHAKKKLVFLPGISTAFCEFLCILARHSATVKWTATLYEYTAGHIRCRICLELRFASANWNQVGKLRAPNGGCVLCLVPQAVPLPRQHRRSGVRSHPAERFPRFCQRFQRQSDNPRLRLFLLKVRPFCARDRMLTITTGSLLFRLMTL